MPTISDVFKIQKQVIDEYKSFVTSYVTIRDEKIKTIVAQKMEEGAYWPQPLIQFNPSFLPGQTMDSLCKELHLHPDLKQILGDIPFYKHQVEAIKKGIAKQNFVVTSGTGSGKSLTYIVPIFNDILTNPQQKKGTTAIIVYPMNALINSQMAKIQEYCDTFKNETGRQFPVNCKKYTGQESEQERKEMRTNVPHVILTNYMMLELILTRHIEQPIRNEIKKNLSILVFDELHTYRGRQGADVAMLIHRIHALTHHDVVCIGTSATMAKGASIEQEQQVVANFASQIFGKKIGPEHIVREELQRSFSLTEDEVTIESVQNVLTSNLKLLQLNFNEIEDSLELTDNEAELCLNPLANWIEINAALEKKENLLVRGTPLSLQELSQRLADYTGMDIKLCEAKIKEVLHCIMELNETIRKKNILSEKKKSFYLPFKLHQFISQTGVVYVSLDTPEKRHISLEPIHHHVNKAKKKIYFYQTVFSRYSGYEFLCITLDPNDRMLLPRDYNDYNPLKIKTEEEEEDTDNNLMGYLLTHEELWNPAEDLEKLPSSWFKMDKNGDIKYQNGLPVILQKYKERLPRLIWYDISGRYAEQPIHPFKGWFMPIPLLFDPTCGMVYNARTWELTKLSRLGSEGRSTSTTVLSIAVLKALGHAGFTNNEQKIMSFTDNRQDAALQSGHFNDFLRVAELRSALYRGISRGSKLDFTMIDQVVMDELQLTENDYAKTVSTFSYAKKNNEQALKKYLLYRILEDLKRSWKISLPNLEATGLLRITYSQLDEMCEEEEKWHDVPILGQVPVLKRKELVFHILDYFRTLYAIHSEEFLSRQMIEKNRREISDFLKEPWKFKVNEKIGEPNWLYLIPPSKRVNKFTESIGPRSYLGRYLKDEMTLIRPEGRPKDTEYIEVMTDILDILSGANLIVPVTVPAKNDGTCTLYQLRISAIVWEKGDGSTVPTDPVRNRAYRDFTLQPNRYFQQLYKTDFRKLKKMESAEHTGQLDNEDRITRENEFKQGKLSALFCSPTMELGIDIAELSVVHMRNVPPLASNYVQRSGRAGRSGQAALVFTNCSLFSPHDRHYFDRKTEMVNGVVAAPRINLTNQELLQTHLHAMILSIKQIHELSMSVKDVFDWNKPDFTITNNERDALQITEREKEHLIHLFNKMVHDITDDLYTCSWFHNNWALDILHSFQDNFVKALGRWKKMYQAVQDEIETITQRITGHLYKTGSKEMKDNKQRLSRAEYERGVLCNDTNAGSYSEFYPYRYLAAEGFLPGYNFYRLPIRVSIPVGETVAYISRPRPIAIKEFGPQNIIYHSGVKYRIDKMMFETAEKQLDHKLVAPDSGFVIEDDKHASLSPFNNASLSGRNKPEKFQNLLYMSEAKAERIDRISCEEEIRTTMGYTTATYFTVPGGMERVITASLYHEEKEYLQMKYIPACKIYTFNLGWKIAKEQGFYIGLKTGKWKRKKSVEEKEEKTQREREENKKVGLFTDETADALYLIPIKTLNLCPDGVITLQYALKQSIVNIFGVEENEIGVVLMGSHPNILIYEASQGSLGILSRFVHSKDLFTLVIKEIIALCRFDDTSYSEDASYDDLLSYYNQRDHNKINRFLIESALEQLLLCDVRLQKNNSKDRYREKYEELCTTYDKNSVCEKKFIDYLYGRGLQLPDKAQPQVPGIYIKPDFLYKPDIYIFCDGGIHNNWVVADADNEKRNALLDAGYTYLVYHYDDDIAVFIERHGDIFRKVQT